MKKVLIISALAAATAFAQAGAPKTPQDDSTYFAKGQLDGMEQKIQGGFSTRLFNASTYSTAFIRLEAPDSPHAHGVWSEIFLIKEGSATLHTAGKIVGDVKPGSAVHRSIFTDASGNPQAQQPQPQAQKGPATPRVASPANDISGTSIEGGHTQQVHAGDVVLIPAGVAHWFEAVETPVVYLDIKFPKAD
jgi:mannose-6-phosphate isomerase-like protein (cupin superfamily)